MASGDGKRVDSHLPPGFGKSGPLDTLVFLLPLVIFYEAASFFSGPPAGQVAGRGVVAFQLMQLWFELFGSTVAFMPALAVVGVLLLVQMRNRLPWRVRGWTVAGMYAESAALALPLVLVSGCVALSSVGGGRVGVIEAALGVGAGVYEEMVFRLVLVSLLVMVGVDLLGWSRAVSMGLAVVLSGILFAAHHLRPLGSEGYDDFKFLFRTFAGVYLGVVFLWRGYGPAAGAHAAYNLMILSMS